MVKDERSMSDESIGYLEDVKKGKPRKFAMICKGAEVVSLVVYKKGNVEKQKKEAKQSGKGQFYFGVVDGKGIDLRFVLARSDGFEVEPVKPTKLKSFLEEAADIKCKPHFEIVDAAPLALDETDPLVARFLALKSSALMACQTHPDRAATINSLCLQIDGHLEQDQPDDAIQRLEELESLLAGLGVSPSSPSSVSQPTSSASSATTGAATTASATTAPSTSEPVSSPAPSAIEAKLIDALKRLKPLMDKVLEKTPDRKAEIAGKVVQIREQLKNKEFTAAQVDIVALGKLLQSLSSNPIATEPATSASGDQAALFTQRLKELLPGIKSLAGTPAGDQLKLLASEAGVYARKQDFVQALGILERAKSLLDGKNAPVTEDGLKDSDQFEALKLRVEPKFQNALLVKPDKRETLQKAWNYARDQALDGKIPSAIATLVKLEASIDKLLAESGAPAPTTPSNDAPAKSNVAFQKSLLAWESACKQMSSKLAELEQAIFSLFEDDPRLASVKANIHKLDAVLGDYADELRDRLDEAYNAPDQFKPDASSDAKAALSRYRDYLATDPFIQAIDSNPVVPIGIESILGKALLTIEGNLGT